MRYMVAIFIHVGCDIRIHWIRSITEIEAKAAEPIFTIMSHKRQWIIRFLKLRTYRFLLISRLTIRTWGYVNSALFLEDDDLLLHINLQFLQIICMTFYHVCLAEFGLDINNRFIDVFQYLNVCFIFHYCLPWCWMGAGAVVGVIIILYHHKSILLTCFGSCW